MHDIKIIRKNSDFFNKKISERYVNIDIKNLLDLDKKNKIGRASCRERV